MIYVVVNDLKDPQNIVWAIMTDNRSELLGVVDTNCQPTALPTEHTFGETLDNPPCTQ